MAKFQRRTAFVDEYRPYIQAYIIGMVIGVIRFFADGGEICFEHIAGFLLYALLGGVISLGLFALLVFL